MGIDLLIYVLIACLVIAGLWYVVNNLLPEPMRRFANVILVVLGIIFLIYILGSFLGTGHSHKLFSMLIGRL
jgi:uncharacterized membrane protein